MIPRRVPVLFGRPSLTKLEEAAVAAARANNASLLYVRPDLANVWQDSGGSTPAAAAGHPVGLLLDQQYGRDGGGYNASQATSAARPTLTRLATGQWGLRFDGVDDILLTDGTRVAASPYTLIAAGTFLGAGSVLTAFCSGTSAGPNLNLGLGARMAGASTSGPAFCAQFSNDIESPNAAVRVGVPIVLEAVRRTTGRTLYGGGDALVNDANTTPLVSNNGFGIGGAPFSSSWQAPTTLALFCLSSVAMSDAHRRAIAKFGAALCGAVYQ